MYSEGRLTRSRARTLAAEGQATPLVEIPDGKTPRTRTRKGTEAPTPRAALFDVTNAESQDHESFELPPVDETRPLEIHPSLSQDSAAAAAVIEQDDEAGIAKECVKAIFTSVEQEVSQQQLQNLDELQTVKDAADRTALENGFPAGEEQISTDTVAELALQVGLRKEESVEVVAHEAAEEPPTTPSPATSTALNAAVPTPTGLGLSSFAPLSPLGTTIVVSANTPTVTPLHGVSADAKIYDTLNAAAKAFAQQEHGDAGFGSPVKPDSPAMSVSIGGHISIMDCEEAEQGEDEVKSKSPLGLQSTAWNSPEAVQKHSTPVRMPSQSSTGGLLQESIERPASSIKKFSPLAAPRDAVPRAAVRSKVVVASPFDPRSLRQLKKEIKQKFAEKEEPSAANSEDEADEQLEEVARAESAQDEYEDTASDEEYEAEETEELLAAMEALQLNSPELNPYHLFGMPKPEGKHIRFDDDGDQYVSPRLKTLLRGMPTPHGKHMFFEDDDE